MGLQLAMQSLLSGDSDTCIIGGVNLKLNEYQDVVLSQIPVLSTEGKCKFGDAYADGFVAADGAGVLILRRRSDALRDGNRIWATIRSAVVTNDGARGGSATAPSTDAHVELLARALNAAKLNPNDVDFIEAHGPGAPLIDRMELEAINTVFGTHPDRTRPLFVSSGKSVFGHSEAAAGVTSLVRTILSLESRVALPSNHIRQLHRSIDWSQTQLKIPREPVALKSTGPLIAGVSAQGISSVNAHVILENWEPTSRPADSLLSPPCLVASAPTRSALRATIISFQQRITESVGTAIELNDVIWTALLGREIFNCRVAFLADTQTQLLSLIQTWLAESESEPTHQSIVATYADEILGGRLNAARAFVEDGDAEPLIKITTPGRIVSAPGYNWRRSRHWIPGSRLQAASGT